MTEVHAADVALRHTLARHSFRLMEAEATVEVRIAHEYASASAPPRDRREACVHNQVLGLLAVRVIGKGGPTDLPHMTA